MLLGAAVNQSLADADLRRGDRCQIFVAGHTDDFAVEVGGADRSVSSLAVNGGVVALTLGDSS